MEKKYQNQPLHGPGIDEGQDSSHQQPGGQQESKKIAHHPFQFKNLSQNSEIYKEFDLNHLPKQAFAGFWIRTFAYLVDLFFIRTASQIFYNLTLYRLFSTSISQHWTLHILNFIFLILYFFFMTYYFNGQSFGKMLFGLRVIRRDGGTIDRQSCLVRETAGRLIINIIPFVAVFLVVDDQRQHLVDQWCDTVVINEKQLKMLQAYI